MTTWTYFVLISRVGRRVRAEMSPTKTITITAKPQDYSFAPSATAVIAIDLQNDFGAKGGYVDSFEVPLEGTRATIRPIARVLDAARAASIPIVYTKMEFKRDLSNVGGPDSPNRERLGLGGGDFLIENTWNTEIVPELAPRPGDAIVSKQRYSGFFQTDLDDILRARDITNLVFVGWTTSVCVESTVRDAVFRDYRCVVLEDCTAEPIGRSQVRTNHEASLFVIQAQFGWVADSRGFIDGRARAAALGSTAHL
jgi:ureidoacrylate peracid hydrolase